MDLLLNQQLKERGIKIDEVAPNEEGIRQLIREGKIRPASTSDIENWAKAAQAHNNNAQPKMHLGLTYVVLSDIQFPRGMYGGHSRAFILNENAPMPTGEIGHNTVYLLKGGVCESIGCNF